MLNHDYFDKKSIDKPIIGAVNENSLLSSTQNYPHYMRMVVSDTFNAMIYAQLITFFK